MNTTSWQIRALCRAHDPEIWHPIGTSGPAASQIARAKRLCHRCPVVMECAAWAIEVLEHGIAGALTAEEREQIRQDRRMGQLGLPIVGAS